MDEPRASAEGRAQLFCEQAGMHLVKPLGHGIDGNVWQTNRQSAVKAFAREDTYLRERDCYRRLFENEVDVLAGFEVPLLKDYSNALLVVEMSLVSPPCILDFGKAYV